MHADISGTDSLSPNTLQKSRSRKEATEYPCWKKKKKRCRRAFASTWMQTRRMFVFLSLTCETVFADARLRGSGRTFKPLWQRCFLPCIFFPSSFFHLVFCLLVSVGSFLLRVCRARLQLREVTACLRRCIPGFIAVFVYCPFKTGLQHLKTLFYSTEHFYFTTFRSRPSYLQLFLVQYIDSK